MNQADNRLSLRSRLSDIAQLPPWIQRLASQHAIPENVEFAINLCLEEAVSNVIRHGYGDNADGPVMVSFTMPKQDLFVFAVEDEAQHFNPLDEPTLHARGTERVGGRGVHFLRRFADKLEYEETPAGNRLQMTFSPAALQAQLARPPTDLGLAE